MLVPALSQLPVTEYAPNVVKKSLVGAGHADKKQIRTMVEMLLPRCAIENEDASDALALAICHAHHDNTAERIASSVSEAETLHAKKAAVR
jgi:crossover junction endodeoxyribonuclease RuvC